MHSISRNHTIWGFLCVVDSSAAACEKGGVSTQFPEASIRLLWRAPTSGGRAAAGARCRQNQLVPLKLLRQEGSGAPAWRAKGERL